MTYKPQPPKEPEPKPGVEVGDHLYVHHKGQPCTGLVKSHGRHGVTVEIGGQHHKVKWEHVLGHKKRALQRYSVVDEGEDGMLVQDGTGRRRFIATPNESKEDPMVAKSYGYTRPVLFIKANGAPPGPGLQQKKVTDKNGVQTTKWVRIDRGGPPAQKGQYIGFANGEHKGHGEVTASGRDGVRVKDGAGGQHLVTHDKVTHHWGGDGAPDASPHVDAAAQTQERHQQYAKMFKPSLGIRRDDMPQVPSGVKGKFLDELRASGVSVEDATVDPKDLKPSQSTYNADNMDYLTAETRAGRYDAKTRILVSSDGRVLDGHHRWAVAALEGKDLPITKIGMTAKKLIEVAKKFNAENGVQSRSTDGGATKPQADGAEDIARALFNTSEIDKLPTKVNQPVKSWDELKSKGEEGLTQYKDMLGKVAQSLGLVTGKRPQSLDHAQHEEGVKAEKEGRKAVDLSDADYMLPEHWDDDRGYLFMGPLKGEDRAKEKVDQDYNGDWSQLRDMVRATIAVPAVTQIPKVLAELKAAGIELAQKPKNNLVKPLPGGYRDINMIVRLPNGLLAEMQVHVKPMTLAKEKGHKPYETTRSIEGKYRESGVGSDTSKWDAGDRDKHAAAMQEQEKLYGDAWERASNGGKKQQAASSNLTKAMPMPTIILWNFKGAAK